MFGDDRDGPKTSSAPGSRRAGGSAGSAAGAAAGGPSGASAGNALDQETTLADRMFFGSREGVDYDTGSIVAGGKLGASASPSGAEGGGRGRVHARARGARRRVGTRASMRASLDLDESGRPKDLVWLMRRVGLLNNPVSALVHRAGESMRRMLGRAVRGADAAGAQLAAGAGSIWQSTARMFAKLGTMLGVDISSHPDRTSYIKAGR